MCAHERTVEQPSALLMRGGMLGMTETLPLCGSAKSCCVASMDVNIPLW